MELKHIRRSWRRSTGFIALKVCSLIIYFLPLDWLRVISKTIADIFYVLAKRPRRIAQNSLDLAFGETISKVQKKRIAKDSFRHMLAAGFDLLFCIGHPEYIEKVVDIEGRSYLDNALARNKGVIAVTAHFGNFALMQFKLAKEGYRVNSIIRHMRDLQADKYFLKKRNGIGVKTIYTEPRNVCVMQSIKSLKNNEILFILLDQNFGTGGIFVDFFGRKAATATGPIVLAQRTEAAIIPMFFVHTAKGKHRLIIEREFKLENASGKNEAILLNIQRLTDIIERYIRSYPAEWSWIHRRWKTRPKNN